MDALDKKVFDNLIGVPVQAPFFAWLLVFERSIIACRCQTEKRPSL